jgi:phosphate transport system substrate-binding protein
MPSVETARDASYQPLARPLFMYVNKAHLEENEDVRQHTSSSSLDP